MTFQLFIDGRPERTSNKMSNALLAKLQKEDNHAQIMDEFLKRDAMENSGTYGFQGVVGDINANLTVPKGMTGEISKAQRVQRVKDRMARREPCKPLAYVEGYEVDLLSVEDQEAYEEGWICPRCIQYQGMPAAQCNWQFKGDRPTDPKDWGCGYRRF